MGKFRRQSRVRDGGRICADGRTKAWKFVLPLLLATFLVVCLIGGGLYYRSHQQSKRLTEKDSVVLTDFANSTGDPIFDDALKTALNVSLRQSPFVNVLPESRIAGSIRSAPPGGRAQVGEPTGSNPFEIGV